MATIVKSPWEDVFVDLLANAKEAVYLASPFVKLSTSRVVAKHIRGGVDFKLITSFKLANFHRRASDLDALKVLLENNCSQKSVHNLHAKLYLFDDTAIITSSNLTPTGLKRNVEYGVLLENGTADQLRVDFLRYFDDPEYPYITIDIISKARRIIQSVPPARKVKLPTVDPEFWTEYALDQEALDYYDGGVESIRKNLTSWKRDVFDCLLQMKTTFFSLDEVYSFENTLQRLHPKNKNIRAKIRQQLQYLRDIGLVEFVRPGLYRKLWKDV